MQHKDQHILPVKQAAADIRPGNGSRELPGIAATCGYNMRQSAPASSNGAQRRSEYIVGIEVALQVLHSKAGHSTLYK
jgi:hypothetical protein